MMRIVEQLHDGWERVVEFSDDEFCCFIALHSTKLGPALGGCRVKSYDSADHALMDAKRLSKAMSYKNSLAGLHFGGGKCVVMAEEATPEIMRKVGEAVNYFGGDYITAEDVGTTMADLADVAEVTPYAVRQDGSEMTALGVYYAMQAAVEHQGDWDDLDSVPVWIEGLGKVGGLLLDKLRGHPNLHVSDVRDEVVVRACKFGAHQIAEADKRFIGVYAPCAMGQVVNAGNLASTRYSIICGAANNQLADDAYAEALQTNGVLYCPDFVVNAGGVIAGAGEINKWTEDEVRQYCQEIGTTLGSLLNLSKEENMTPLAIAKTVAEMRLTNS